MVSNSVRYHNLVASMNTAYGKGDMKAVNKWALELAELAQPAQVPLPAAPAVAPAPVDQSTDSPEVVFDPATWPPLALALGTIRMGKYGEVFGSAIPASNVYTDLQTSGGYDGRANVPPMFYLFLRGKIIYAQEGNLDPVTRLELRTKYRPDNTAGLVG